MEKPPAPTEERRRGGDVCASLFLFSGAVHQMLSPWFWCSGNPLSSPPQPLGSGGDAPATSTVAERLLCVVAKRATVIRRAGLGWSHHAVRHCVYTHSWSSWTRPLLRFTTLLEFGDRAGEVVIRAAPKGVEAAGAALWQHHSRQAGTPRKGDQPKDWWAPSQETALTIGIPCGWVWYVGLWATFATGERTGGIV